MSYGLPPRTTIYYGGSGFPQWVYDLADVFGLKASTYANHQTSHRVESGYAPNPGLNRGIDWTGSVASMQRFAEYLLTVKGSLEQVIWENPETGSRVGVAGGQDVSRSSYFASDFSGHRDHVHTRQSKPIPIPAKKKTVGWQGDPVWLEDVLRESLGDRLVVHEGWEKRGTGAGPGGQMGDIWGVMLHHTGSDKETPERIRDGVWQSKTYFLPGPLSQCLITPDGKCHLVAVGPCNHAGVGSYPGLGTNNGNGRLIGFECAWPTIRSDGTYDKNQPWPDAQILTMRDATAAVLKRLGYGSDRVIGHKDYAGAAQGKWDPGNLDVVGWFRTEVNKILKSDKTIQPPPVQHPVDDDGGFLMALTDAEQRELLDLARQQSGVLRVSRSPVRRLGEGPTQTVTGFEWSTDGSVHLLLVELLASLGHPPTLSLLSEIANADPTAYPDRQEDRKIAQAILNKLQMNQAAAANPVVYQQLPPPAPAAAPPPAPAATPVPAAVEAAPAAPAAPAGDGNLFGDMNDLRGQIHQITESLAALSNSFLGRKP